VIPGNSGTTDLVIRDGRPAPENLRKNNLSDADLLEDLRLKGVSSPEDVVSAHIERNGEVSVVKKPRPAQ
jgi:uncharacterized membrane protein YcaP (DUF421 family)